MPRSGKVVVKVSLSLPMGVGLIPQELAHWAVYVWVQGKSRLKNRQFVQVKLVWSLFAPWYTSPPPTPLHFHQHDMNHHNNKGLCLEIV